MNPSERPVPLRKQRALVTLVGVSLVLGVIDAAFAARLPADGARFAITMAGNIVALLVGFHWLNLDSFERGIRRPVWLDIGIVLLAAGFVPYYLYKTRPTGRRGRAIMGFFALIGTCIIASAIGAMAMMSLQGAPPAA